MNHIVAPCIILLILVLPAHNAQAQELVVEEVTIEQFQQILQESDAVLKVVNFWATWCAPCIEEFPYFIQLGKDLADQGVAVFFVSMDFEGEQPAVEAFLAEQGFSDRSYLRVGEDQEFITTIHEEWTGALPATFLYSQNGSLADFWQGTPGGYEALKERVMKALQP